MPDRSDFFWLFFSLSGRVSRAAYFLAGALLYMARFFPIYKIIAAGEDRDTATMWGGVFLLVVAAVIYPHIALTVKRLHDFGRSGWFAVLFIIGDFFLFVGLSLVKGDPGPNRYGRRTDAPG